MPRLRHTLILVIILAGPIAFTSSCGSDRYEIVEDKNGRIIRLDKKTGKTYLVQNGKLVELREAKPATAVTTPATVKGLGTLPPTPNPHAAKKSKEKMLIQWPGRPLDLVGVGNCEVKIRLTKTLISRGYDTLGNPIDRYIDELQYLLNLTSLSEDFGPRKNWGTVKSIKLKDGSGFEVERISIQYTALRPVLDTGGNTVGYTVDSRLSPVGILTEDFMSIEDWSL